MEYMRNKFLPLNFAVKIKLLKKKKVLLRKKKPHMFYPKSSASPFKLVIDMPINSSQASIFPVELQPESTLPWNCASHLLPPAPRIL